MKLSLGFGVFLCLVVSAVGTHFFTIKKYSGQAIFRNPAAINPRALDLTDEQILDSVSKQRILSGTRAWKKDGSIAITVGHFLAQVEGETLELCQIYQEISITFAAEGMAVSGDRPTMTINSPCKVARNSDLTEPIWIPVEKILVEKPADTELRFTSPSDISILLRNIPGEWPSYWVMTELKLQNKSDGRFISIDKATIYKLSQVPVSISFN